MTRRAATGRGRAGGPATAALAAAPPAPLRADPAPALPPSATPGRPSSGGGRRCVGALPGPGFRPHRRAGAPAGGRRRARGEAGPVCPQRALPKPRTAREQTARRRSPARPNGQHRPRQVAPTAMHVPQTRYHTHPASTCPKTCLNTFNISLSLCKIKLHMTYTKL